MMFSDFNIEDSFFYIEQKQLDDFKLVMENTKNIMTYYKLKL